MAKALLIVDVQNDFCKHGALEVPGAESIIPIINSVIKRYDPNVTPIFTMDWHPREHVSFEETGGDWPEHCIMFTPGALLHQNLQTGIHPIICYKGYDPIREAYSAFMGVVPVGNEYLPLDLYLGARKLLDVEICGLAIDYCVKATALDAIKLGFPTSVYRQACRGVDPKTTAAAWDEMAAAGIKIIDKI